MKFIKLPIPTSQCDEGPLLSMDNSDITIKYDYYYDENIFWTTVRFEYVYAFKFLECKYIDTNDFCFGMVEIHEFDWIKELLKNWEKDNRSLKDIFGGELSKIHHYRMYFDDVGMFEIICKNMEIGA